jgi:LacI family transcriptional regulator
LSATPLRNIRGSDLKIRVSDEVSVIGIDNDEVLCELADPPLTSVDSNAVQIGFQAASLLDQMMAGERKLEGMTLISPGEVIARRSSDAIAVPDREAAAAMRFLREHACEGVNVADVVAHSQLSRSTLERRFKKWFGTSPKEELDRARPQKVKLLLEVTDSPLARIAGLTGFEHSEHMGTAFRRTFGVTPGAFRKSTQRWIGSTT